MIKQQLEFTKQRYLSKELKAIKYKKFFGLTGRLMGQMINFNKWKHQTENFIFPVEKWNTKYYMPAEWVKADE